MDFNTIRDHLMSLGQTPGAPAAEHALASFERRHDVSLPSDVRQNYSIMNGSEAWTDGAMIRFWPIDEWTPATREFAGDDVLEAMSPRVFVCADFGIECAYYVIDLDKASPTFGHVYGLGATRPGHAAANFSEFVAKVAEDSGDLHNYG